MKRVYPPGTNLAHCVRHVAEQGFARSIPNHPFRIKKHLAVFLYSERVKGVEPSSQPWEGRILAVEPHPRWNAIVPHLQTVAQAVVIGYVGPAPVLQNWAHFGLICLSIHAQFQTLPTRHTS